MHITYRLKRTKLSTNIFDKKIARLFDMPVCLPGEKINTTAFQLKYNIPNDVI